ncbi:MAG: hypothetical protein Q7R41_16925 [Phycisphaerales bacterium]|nr:hypothetical protein [Phycisphaerales bacterium]
MARVFRKQYTRLDAERRAGIRESDGHLRHRSEILTGILTDTRCARKIVRCIGVQR